MTVGAPEQRGGTYMMPYYICDLDPWPWPSFQAEREAKE